MDQIKDLKQKIKEQNKTIDFLKKEIKTETNPKIQKTTRLAIENIRREKSEHETEIKERQTGCVLHGEFLDQKEISETNFDFKKKVFPSKKR